MKLIILQNQTVGVHSVKRLWNDSWISSRSLVGFTFRSELTQNRDGKWQHCFFSSDLSFEATGYFFVLLNDVFTAANGVYMKRALNSKVCSPSVVSLLQVATDWCFVLYFLQELGEFGLLFYNSTFIFIPVTLFLTFSNEFEKVRSESAEPFPRTCICSFVLLCDNVWF